MIEISSELENVVNWSISFMILAAGGIIFELLSIKRMSEKSFQDLYSHTIFLSRKYAIFTFSGAIISAAIVPIIPDDFIIAPILVFSITFIAAALFYMKGVFGNSKYMLIHDLFEKDALFFREKLIIKALTEADGKIKFDALVSEVQRLLIDQFPNLGRLKSVVEDALLETSFQPYQIKKTLQNLVLKDECQKHWGNKYSYKNTNT